MITHHLLVRTGTLVCALLATHPSSASADDTAPTTDAPAGQYAVLRGVQGPAGMFSARILFDMNLSSGAFGEPISIAPDLFFALSNRLQVGLVHQGPLGWQARPGLGVCLTGESNGCPKLYDNLGFDAMYGILFDRTSLSLHASLFINTFDPAKLGLGLGFAGKTRFGDSAALVYDPKIVIAANERDAQDDALVVPLELEVQLGAADALHFLSGIYGSLSAFGDGYQIPLGLGLVHNLSPHFDIGARFSFDNLLGKEPPLVGRADQRSLAILLNLRS